ncbi:MAG TPA: sugar transferase [Pantanalinema sp.]
MKGLILTGSAHAALAPITFTAPLGALPLLGEALIAHQLRRLSRLGVEDVLVAMHHLPAPLEAAIRSATPEGMRVSVALESALSGSGGALKAHAAFLSQTTLVLSGDVIDWLDLEGAIAHHRATGALVTAVLSPQASPGALGAALTTGGMLKSCAPPERPEVWHTGIYLVEPAALDHLPGTPCAIGREWLPRLSAQGLRVAGHVAEGAWHPAGTPLGYHQAQLAALCAGTAGDAILHVDPGALVHPEATLVPPCWIGPGCRVGREGRIGPHAVLVRDVEVARGASVERSIVLAGTSLGKATRWHDRLVWRHGSFDVDRPQAPFEPSPDPEVLRSTMRAPRGERLGQLLDSSLAIVALLALSPLLLAISLFIYLDDPGPVIFTQLRVGQDRRAWREGSLRGRVFELYKFRTMVRDAERRLSALKAHNHYGDGAFFKLTHDPRITRLGRFLRATSLDELPQLLNVALGDMRLVGNRPLPVYEAEALDEDWQRLRFSCPAGITGLWQISGRSDLSEKERMVLDSYYSVTRTFWSDWLILLKTIPALLLRRGAR